MISRRHVLTRMAASALLATQSTRAFAQARGVPRLGGGRVIHVSPDGSDSGRHDGGSTAPFLTLPRAFGSAVPGDTIVMRGGVYALEGQKSGWLLAGRGGTPTAPIHVTNHPGEVPIIDGRGMEPPTESHAAWPGRTTAGGFPLVLWDVSHVVVRGLTVRNGPMGGAYVHGTHHGLTVEQCVFHDNGWLNDEFGTGLTLLGTGNGNIVRNCDSFGNGGGRPGSMGRNADGFSFALHGSDEVLVEGNRAWRNADDGFDFFNSYPAASGLDAGPCIVDRNWSFENGFFADGRMNPFPLGDGNGFKLGGRREGATGGHGGHTVTRCLAWGNKCNGFDDNGYNGGLAPLTIFNNVSFDNARNDDPDRGDLGFAFIIQFAADTVLRNNIALATRGRNALRITLARHSHNLRNGRAWDQLNPPVALSPHDFVSLDDTVARGPRRPDGSLPISGFLRPNPESALIGRGSRDGLPRHLPAGDIDIGAFTSPLASEEPPARR